MKSAFQKICDAFLWCKKTEKFNEEKTSPKINGIIKPLILRDVLFFCCQALNFAISRQPLFYVCAEHGERSLNTF